MKREFILLLTSLMLIGLLGTASMSQEAGTWTQKADMPTARYKAGAAVVDGKMCIIGGGNPKRRKSRIVHVYDPGTDTWTTAADRPAQTGNRAAAVVDRKIYTIGGRERPPAPTLSTVYEFDPGLPVVIPRVR